MELTPSCTIKLQNDKLSKREELKMKISSKEEFEKLNVFGTGTANTAYAKYFIGDSF